MVQGSESTHGLTISGPFRAPCERAIRAAHVDFTSSPQTSEPKNWEFEVLAKMVIVKQHKIASEEWLTYARAFLAPSLQQSTSQESKRDLSQETKGEARRKNRK